MARAENNGRNEAALHFFHSLDDCLGGDSEAVQKLFGFPTAGNRIHRKSLNRNVFRRQRGGDSIADSAMDIVVLDGDDAATAGAGAINQSLPINGLDTEQVDHANVAEFVVCL